MSVHGCLQPRKLKQPCKNHLILGKLDTAPSATQAVPRGGEVMISSQPLGKIRYPCTHSWCQHCLRTAHHAILTSFSTTAGCLFLAGHSVFTWLWMLVLPCSTESLEYLVQHLEEYLVKNRTVHSNTAARIDTARTALSSSSQSISHLLTAGLLPSQTAADTREDYSNSSGEGILLSDISLHERLVINASFRQSFPNLATLKNQPTGHSSWRNRGSSVLLLTKWLLCKGNSLGQGFFPHTSPKCCHWQLLLKMAVFHCISFITQEKTLTSTEVTVPGIWISFA